MKRALSLSVILAIALAFTTGYAAEPLKSIELWPNGAPGEKGKIGEEHNTTKPKDRMVAGKPVLRIGNVSKPAITIYPAPNRKTPGPAVLVCPGGAYHILAADLEGSEVCEWLNSIGLTGVLLKYRVPNRQGLERHTAALQDAQRAMGLVRSRAAEFNIDPNKIGVMGFSAGGHLSAALSTSISQRTYPAVDAADAVSCRPDFALLIYPAYLAPTNELQRLRPEVTVTTNHPPTFIAMTEDDPTHVENALTYYLALKEAKIPAELHLYPVGGHGYGLRRTDVAVTTWSDRATEWLKGRGLVSQN